MRGYPSAAAFRAALEQHLLREGRARQVSSTRLRKLVVFDRLLACLSAVAPGRWVLKGALALDFRLGGRARATKDMDLARQDDLEGATADLLAVQRLDLADHFSFAIERVRLIDPELEGAAARFRAEASLALDLLTDLQSGYLPLSDFLDPVLSNAKIGTWDAARAAWEPN